MKNLYLCPLSIIKNLSDTTTKLFIARQPFENMKKYNIYHIKKLAPSEELFNDIKRNGLSWKNYVWRYRQEMFNNKDILDLIYKKLETEEIALICYCHTKNCHRYILGHYFSELGINVIEL